MALSTAPSLEPTRAAPPERAAAPPAAIWWVAMVLAAAHLVSLLDRYVTVLLTEALKAAFSLSDTQMGLLHGTGFIILYCGVAIPLGWLADITHRRNMIIAGVLMWSFATIGAAFADGFQMLLATRIFVGLGEACLIPAGMSILAARFTRTTLSRAVAIFGTGAVLGQGVAYIGGGMLLEELERSGGIALPFVGHLAPWQGVILAAGMAGPLVILLLLTVREPDRLQPRTDWAAGGELSRMRFASWLRNGEPMSPTSSPAAAPPPWDMA